MIRSYLRKYAFTITVDNPLTTLIAILEIIEERKIAFTGMQVCLSNPAEGKIILHCSMEQDRIRHFEQLLHKIGGVGGIERFDGNIRNG